MCKRPLSRGLWAVHCRNRLCYINDYLLLFAVALVAIVMSGCSKAVEHTAPAISDRDSVAVMTSYGVNTLISDSGVIKYRIITERWEVNQNRHPSRWTFDKGVFLEQFDETFHINSYIQADTAYYFDQQRLWALHGNVRVLTKDGLRFWSNELYWDENRHELYSNSFSRLVTPERTLQGSYFTSDEKLNHYYVSNTKGSFIKGDLEKNGGDGTENSDSARRAQDSIMKAMHPQAMPRPATVAPAVPQRPAQQRRTAARR